LIEISRFETHADCLRIITRAETRMPMRWNEGRPALRTPFEAVGNTQTYPESFRPNKLKNFLAQ
jgi:hypothetical protein